MFRSSEFTLDQKNDLLQKVLGNDVSDLAQNLKLTCMASLPDPATKEQVWLELIDTNSSFSLYQREGGEDCCAQHKAQAAFDRCKSQAKCLGLLGQGKVE